MRGPLSTRVAAPPSLAAASGVPPFPHTYTASVVSWQIVPVRHRVLGFLFVLMLITYLDRVCFSTTAGAMARDLGLSLEQIGIAGSCFVLGYVLFEIPGGWLADRYGARLMLTRIVI